MRIILYYVYTHYRTMTAAKQVAPKEVTWKETKLNVAILVSQPYLQCQP